MKIRQAANAALTPVGHRRSQAETARLLVASDELATVSDETKRR
jgi:hypothetical protein